jgi:hypothetical protein
LSIAAGNDDTLLITLRFLLITQYRTVFLPSKIVKVINNLIGNDLSVPDEKKHGRSAGRNCLQWDEVRGLREISSAFRPDPRSGKEGNGTAWE